MSSSLVYRFESPERKGEFRATMGEFATGVVAVTALESDESMPVGIVINSFTSVSLEPELVLFCVAHTSTSWPRIRSAGRFCVNILAESQREISKRLAGSGRQKFRSVPWALAATGIPVLDGAIGWLECSIEAEYPAGDHNVIIARVHHLGSPHEGSPLVFFRGSYGRYTAL